MTLTTTYRERVRYEELLLIWLDRINQALQKPFKTTSEHGINLYNAVQSVLALYSLLPKQLREAIDNKINNSIEKYLDVYMNYFYDNADGKIIDTIVMPRDMYQNLEKAYTHRLRYLREVMKRLREVIKTIVDTLHENGLLLKEEYYIEGIERETQT